MTPGKRMFDICLALFFLALLWPVLVVVSGLILIRDGRPVIFRSRRMCTPDRSFVLLKFRTMHADPPDHSVSAGYKSQRITPLGRGLRRTRLDELPQLFNILRGDMSFVGPRPPLPTYVEMCPELYAQVLRNRPGVTGLATLVYHNHEERILARCHSKMETDEVYLRRCVPAKARLDLIWARHRTICFDLVLIWQTIRYLFAYLGPARQKQGRITPSRAVKK